VHADAARALVKELLDILEARLSAQDWMVGEAYSLVDLVVAQVVGYGVYVGARVEGHPVVARWLGRVMARPAMQADA